jgi:hypothetical protein
MSNRMEIDVISEHLEHCSPTEQTIYNSHIPFKIIIQMLNELPRSSK